ncbi:MAG: hypothetical protein RLZZ267_728 [Bacillota bacterium]
MVSILEKLLLVVLAVVNAAVGVVIVKYSNTEAEYIHGWLPSGVDLSIRDVAIIISIIAVIFILRGIQLFARALSPGKEKKHAQSINRKTDLGEIQVSMETLESLSLKAVSRIKGIHEVKANVRVAESGLTIKLRCLMDGDVSIPTISEEMQKAVKEHVQMISGIPVNQVTINVSNIQRSQSSKSRLE